MKLRAIQRFMILYHSKKLLIGHRLINAQHQTEFMLRFHFAYFHWLVFNDNQRILLKVIEVASGPPSGVD